MRNKLEDTFEKFIKDFDMNDKQVSFRYRHSYRVKKLMKELSMKLGLSSKEVKLAEVIGLLHDIGRFEQIKKYGIFSDLKTGMDHADESCIYLFEQGHIKDFYEVEENYPIIEDAIRYHNKYEINKDINDKSLLFAKMIRDMDKTDIYQIVNEEFSFPFNKNDVSQKIIDCFNNKKQTFTKDIKTKTDNVYCHLAFLYDINFPESFEIIKKYNNIEKFFNIVIPNEESKEELNKLKESMILYINNRIETNK